MTGSKDIYQQIEELYRDAPFIQRLHLKYKMRKGNAMAFVEKV